MSISWTPSSFHLLNEFQCVDFPLSWSETWVQQIETQVNELVVCITDQVRGRVEGEEESMHKFSHSHLMFYSRRGVNSIIDDLRGKKGLYISIYDSEKKSERNLKARSVNDLLTETSVMIQRDFYVQLIKRQRQRGKLFFSTILGWSSYQRGFHFRTLPLKDHVSNHPSSLSCLWSGQGKGGDLLSKFTSIISSWVAYFSLKVND